MRLRLMVNMNAQAFTYHAYNGPIPVQLDHPLVFKRAHPWWDRLWCQSCHHRFDQHLKTPGPGRFCPGCSGCFEERR